MPTTLTKSAPRVQQKIWTQVDFHTLPEGPPYYELEDGELIEMARPRGRHQRIVGMLFATLNAHINANKLGMVWPEVEVDLTPTITYVPDLCFLATGNLHLFEDDIAIDGPPDLVVEVLSPSTAMRDKTTKQRIYQRTGVKWYWLIEPNLLISEYKNTDEGFLITDIVAPPDSFAPKLFPGFRFNLAKLLGELEEGETEAAPENQEQEDQGSE